MICTSCGISNPADAVRCFSCGSDLHFAPQQNIQKQHTIEPKNTSKVQLHFFKAPQWLKAIVVTFVFYVAAVSVYQFLQSPSGTVQRQSSQVHNHDQELLEQIRNLEQQVSANPNNDELILQFANLLHDARLYSRAIEMYKKHLVLNPKNNDARVDLGICYFETDNFEMAVKEIESVIAADKKHQMAMFNLGVIQLSRQNIAESQYG